MPMATASEAIVAMDAPGVLRTSEVCPPAFHYRSNSSKEAGPIPRLDIVIMVIGSRGDIQPFIEVGRILQTHYGHRVRVATHPVFMKLVQDECGLEHFSIGGDPAQLMAFMVKNPGMLPKLKTMQNGDIASRRREMRQMFDGLWRACITPRTYGEQEESPFVADAIIANPPCIVHAHCAERLGCHLHVMFTFPYTPTKSFPHPLAALSTSDGNVHHRNLLSYKLVDTLTWQGLGDVINHFRKHTLKLPAVSTLYATSHQQHLPVPYTYLWSSSLAEKPPDWDEHTRIVGFAFLDLAKKYSPTPELAQFLAAGDPPVYIGFGSIVIDDPKAFSSMILGAVQDVGVRAIISTGWGGFASEMTLPENIITVQDTPHDWLFPRCCAVVHHGGAGTTAAGLRYGRPTVIIPFFGDQAFWGSRVSLARAGAHECIHYKRLTRELLARSIKECLTDQARQSAGLVASNIAHEGNGADNAVRHFHDKLDLDGPSSWRCFLFKDHVAVWESTRDRHFRLSATAAEAMVRNGQITYKDLKLYRWNDWTHIQGRDDPLTGVISAVKEFLLKFLYHMSRGPRSVYRYTQAIYGKNKEPAIFSVEEGQDTGKIPADSIRLAPLEPTTLRFRHHDHESSTNVFEIGRETLFGLLMAVLACLEFPCVMMARITNGFHNLPRLYGDTEIRSQPCIDSFGSGFRAGMLGVVLGVWDAFVGIFSKPARDVKRHGFPGLFTGILKGIGGLVCGLCAAITALPGCVGAGILCMLYTVKSPSNIWQVRLDQGTHALARLDENEYLFVMDSSRRLQKRWWQSKWKLGILNDPKRSRRRRQQSSLV